MNKTKLSSKSLLGLEQRTVFYSIAIFTLLGLLVFYLFGSSNKQELENPHQDHKEVSENGDVPNEEPAMFKP